MKIIKLTLSLLFIIAFLSSTFAQQTSDQGSIHNDALSKVLLKVDASKLKGDKVKYILDLFISQYPKDKQAIQLLGSSVNRRSLSDPFAMIADLKKNKLISEGLFTTINSFMKKCEKASQNKILSLLEAERSKNYSLNTTDKQLYAGFISVVIGSVKFWGSGNMGGLILMSNGGVGPGGINWFNVWFCDGTGFVVSVGNPIGAAGASAISVVMQLEY